MERYLWDESARSYRARQVGGGSTVVRGHGIGLGKLPVCVSRTSLHVSSIFLLSHFIELRRHPLGRS